MTPNNDIKAKLFGLYLGQKVYKNHRYIDDVTEVTTSHIEQILYGNYLTAHYLLLRSIEQLEDEELVVCYHLHSAAIAYDYTQDFAGVLTMAKHWIEQDGIETLLKYRCTADYLRSIGIALPITYLDENHKPVTASVSEQVEWGWIKIV